MAVWEEMMAETGTTVYRKREEFIREFIPIFQSFYSYISQDRERVGLTYRSHAQRGALIDVIPGEPTEGPHHGIFAPRHSQG